MKLRLSLLVLVVIAVSCDCGGGPLDPCETTKCGTGLVCSPATGKCVSESSGGGAGGGTGGGDVGGGSGGGAQGGGGGTLDGGADAGVPCSSGCTGATPFCDVLSQTCVECRNMIDCSNGAACDYATHRCLAPPDAGMTDGGSDNGAVVYGHTGNTLYKVNATTKVVTRVANFSNCNGEVIDLALDQFSRAFVTTQTGLYQLNLATAQCMEINSSLFDFYPNSLSFVPQGTIDPNFEVLVGYSGSSYVRINLTTGAMQTIGTLGGGFVSSGDIVSVIDGGTYLTAKKPNGPSSADYLIEVNPTTGALVQSFGTLPFNDVFGLAFWGGSLYGFSNGGTLFEITFSGTTITATAVPNAQSQTWNGAGSTTAAKLR